VARAILLILTVLSFGVSGYAYFTAVRRTSDPEATERIVTWGPSARRDAWTPELLRYRTMMRWGSGLGLLFFLAFLTVGG
jgi:hypothetical protein